MGELEGSLSDSELHDDVQNVLVLHRLPVSMYILKLCQDINSGSEAHNIAH